MGLMEFSLSRKTFVLLHYKDKIEVCWDLISLDSPCYWLIGAKVDSNGCTLMGAGWEWIFLEFGVFISPKIKIGNKIKTCFS